jgi:hypothetical protein
LPCGTGLFLPRRIAPITFYSGCLSFSSRIPAFFLIFISSFDDTCFNLTFLKVRSDG